MSEADFVLKRGDRIATVRCNPRFMIVSSDWTTRQVDQVPHADALGDFPQLRAAGREEAAQQTIAAEPFHPVAGVSLCFWFLVAYGTSTC
jgi:hypothetical protein